MPRSRRAVSCTSGSSPGFSPVRSLLSPPSWRLSSRPGSPWFDVADVLVPSAVERAGKVDWIAAGLRTVRADTAERRAIDAVDTEPHTCAPDTPLRDVPQHHSVIVLNTHGVVLGRVPPDTCDDDGRVAEDVMEPGPATVRANEALDPLLARMVVRKVPEMLVTTPEGLLLGIVRSA